ncbi:MAG: ThuA domain-containing protein [Gloeobacteraceae cyanobacterium ES-bin-144]|nr:ThuA domain-containing protein [Verrucomicrobiales bacterium]
MSKNPLCALALAIGLIAPLAAAPKHKLLFFTKSSGFEHSVISWKTGQPSFAEKVFLEIGAKNSWEFEFSKDGSKFSPEYLAGFDAVIFYTTGDLTKTGTDGQPAMSPEGKQALFDYIKGGKGFVGLHSATDTFHTNNEAKKGADRFANHGKNADSYICMIGGEFIIHGAQQVATNKVINPKFPGFEKTGDSFAFHEEWYSLKDFNPDIHCLTVIDSPAMQGDMYKRPPFPTTWARKEGKGRVFYTAMGHRDDIWTNPVFQDIVVGGIRWATSEVDAEVPPNLKTAAPEAMTNPAYKEPEKKPTPAPAPALTPAQ